MISGRIKRLIYTPERLRFHRICKANKLQLNYRINRDALNVLTEIFEDREYADFFPFYQQATVIDIGAHYGYFSIFASLNLHEKAKVIALEPFKKNYEKLEGNIKNCKITNILGLNCAVSDNSGTARLNVGKSDNNSLLKNYKLLPKGATEEEVQVKTLEEVVKEHQIEKIDFLKMDCEGSEYAILRNMSPAIFGKIRTIAMEFHDLKDVAQTGEEIIRILMKNGFEIVKYRYDKTTMGLNYGKIIGTKVLNEIRKADARV